MQEDYRLHLSNHLDESETWEFGTGQVLTGPFERELKPTKLLIDFKSKSRSEKQARQAANAKRLVEMSAADPSYPAGVVSRMISLLQREQFDKIFELSLKVDSYRRRMTPQAIDAYCQSADRQIAALMYQKNVALDSDDYGSAEEIANEIDKLHKSKRSFQRSSS